MRSNISDRKKENCSGCGACRQVCPVNAITMGTDTMGFVYPQVNEDLCINCGKCLTVCGFEPPKGSEPHSVYAAVGNKALQVRDSASGGAFAVLASSCVADGGSVAGAVMECADGINVYHLMSGSSADISLMQGSKYVQSDVTACYDALLSAVKAGDTVFFSGTPCQVAAVKKLTGDPENLITADLICHGVPSRQLLEDFFEVLNYRLRGEVTDFRFRDKLGKKPFTATIRVTRGEKEKAFRLRSSHLSYYQYFLSGDLYRDSCYQCPFATTRRVGDLTLGDFWGVEKYYAREMRSEQIPKHNVWSCVLVNTQKGEAFLKRHGTDMTLLPSKLQWVVDNNAQLRQPSTRTRKGEALRRAYDREGYKGIERIFMQEQGGTVRYYIKLIKHMFRHYRKRR